MHNIGLFTGQHRAGIIHIRLWVYRHINSVGAESGQSYHSAICIFRAEITDGCAEVFPLSKLHGIIFAVSRQCAP